MEPTKAVLEAAVLRTDIIATCSLCGCTTQDMIADKWCMTEDYVHYVCLECAADNMEYVECVRCAEWWAEWTKCSVAYGKQEEMT